MEGSIGKSAPRAPQSHAPPSRLVASRVDLLTHVAQQQVNHNPSLPFPLPFPFTPSRPRHAAVDANHPICTFFLLLYFHMRPP